MWVAARRPAHKEQSLSYDIKGIVQQASAQRPPYMGSLCKEVHVFILVVMGMNTHTYTHTSAQPPPPPSASPCTDFSWHKFILLCGTCWLVSHHVAAFSTWTLKYEPGNSVFLRYKGGAGWNMLRQGMAWGWEEGLMYNSGCATTNCQRYPSGLSRESHRTDEKQSWLQRRVKHDLGKSPAVTTHPHSVYHLWTVHGNMCKWCNMFKHLANTHTRMHTSMGKYSYILTWSHL